MIKTDKQGNLFTIYGNSAVITLKELPDKKGKLVCCFNGDSEVRKELPFNGQTEAIIKLTKKDIEDIGAGVHPYYIDIVYNDDNDVDTLIYQTITVYEKD